MKDLLNKMRSGQSDKQKSSAMTNPNPPSQFQPAAMEVNAELSPITSNANVHVPHLMSSTHLSNINHLADSQPTEDLTSAYNNSTVMDQTIIGGLTFSSVWAAEWPPFGKLLPARLTICSHCILSICNIYLFPVLF